MPLLNAKHLINPCLGDTSISWQVEGVKGGTAVLALSLTSGLDARCGSGRRLSGDRWAHLASWRAQV